MSKYVYKNTNICQSEFSLVVKTKLNLHKNIFYIYVIMSKKIKTTTSLVIVESPAKCKKIEQYLGPGYK